MIYVDPRAGSKELAAPLHKMGVPVDSSAALAFGDLAFVSHDKRAIGIEFKTAGECITALRSGRLVGHQLPGMLGAQGIYDCAWLLIEGEWVVTHDGLMGQRRRGGMVPLPGKMPASEWHKRLLTLSDRGLRVWCTPSRTVTLHWIVDTYRWYTDGGHESGAALYRRPLGIGFTAASDDLLAVAAWPGVGGKWGSVALAAFGSVERAVLATAPEWAALESGGRVFGMKAAERLRVFLRGKR